MKNKTRRIVAYSFDLFIAVFVIVSGIMMFTTGGDALAEKGIGFLKYFTVQSNFLAGFVALFALIFDLLLCLGKRNENPLALKIAYLSANTGTLITFLTVVFFLGPTMGYPFMFSGANLFMHLLTPLLVFARVAFFESEGKDIPHRFVFFGAIHLLGYGTFYLANIAIHNGYGQAAYDWYGFGKGGLGIGIIVFIGMLALAYGLTFLNNLLQKKMNRVWDSH